MVILSKMILWCTCLSLMAKLCNIFSTLIGVMLYFFIPFEGYLITKPNQFKSYVPTVEVSYMSSSSLLPFIRANIFILELCCALQFFILSIFMLQRIG